MTNEDAIRWLDNLKNDIGNPHYERLWPYAQAIDEIIALLEGQEAEIAFLKAMQLQTVHNMSNEDIGNAVRNVLRL